LEFIHELASQKESKVATVSYRLSWLEFAWSTAGTFHPFPLSKPKAVRSIKSFFTLWGSEAQLFFENNGILKNSDEK
jgi:hypothetical protein